MTRHADPWSTILWRRARAIFDEVLAVEADLQPVVLADLLAGDDQLRSAVEALMDNDSRTVDLQRDTDHDNGSRRWLGTRLGPYRLLRVLGHGGAGIVFLGARDDEEFDQRVAVKLLLDGQLGDGMERFRRERQILAQLEHPHIARLLDGGSTEDGVPFVVMELVEGIPLTAYCDQHRLNVDARLALFLQMCDAVQQAHRHLVVHRDLKPSNILVSREGQAKLLDFGIAKLLGQDSFSTSLRSSERTGNWLTPAYASPEQLLGAPTTLATDIYSLGVILYELLTGRLPFDTTSRLDVLADSARPPIAPSIVVGYEQVAPPTASSATGPRDVGVRQLRKRLRGDLDHVVLKALRDEPQARYSSVEALARDIERHLNDLPVEARRGSARYRASKFLRRHTLAVSLTAALAVAILGSSIFLFRYSLVLAAERDATEQQRIAAEKVAENLADILRQTRPIKGDRFDLAIEGILDHTAAEIENDFADHPELQAVLALAVGTVYRDLAFWDQAEPLLELATRYRREDPSDVDKTVRALVALGGLRRNQGRGQEAVELMREALDALDADEDSSSSTRAHVMTQLAGALSSQARYAEARAYLELAIELAEDDPRSRLVELAERRNNLSLILRKSGELDAARSLLEQALVEYRRASGLRSLNVASVLNNLASLEIASGEFESAARRLGEALDIRRELQGDDHPDVFLMRANLGAVWHMSGDYDAAEPLYRAVLENTRSTLGSEHPTLATDLSNLGLLLRDMYRLEEADELLTEALDLNRRVRPEQHPITATALNNLGLVLLDLGKIERARDLLEEGLAMRQRTLAENHWKTGTSMSNLAKVHLADRRACRAAELAIRALANLASALPAGHWRHAEAQSVFGAALGELGRSDEAEALLVDSLAIIAAAQSPESRPAADARMRLETFRKAAERPIVHCALDTEPGP